jgi:hypothetical protein
MVWCLAASLASSPALAANLACDELLKYLRIDPAADGCARADELFWGRPQDCLQGLTRHDAQEIEAALVAASSRPAPFCPVKSSDVSYLTIEVNQLVCFFHLPGTLDKVLEGLSAGSPACVVGAALLEDARAQEALEKHPIGKLTEAGLRVWVDRTVAADPGANARMGPLLRWVDAHEAPWRASLYRRLCHPGLYSPVAVRPPPECAFFASKAAYQELDERRALVPGSSAISARLLEKQELVLGIGAGAVLAGTGLTMLAYGLQHQQSGRVVAAFNGVIGGGALGLGLGLFRARSSEGLLTQLIYGGVGLVGGALLGGLANYLLSEQAGAGRWAPSVVTLGAGALIWVPLVWFAN